jgi:phosphoribosylanthranilate isomerase
MTRVKVCGITNWEDAQAAVEFGANALGFIFAQSPRRMEPDEARRIVERLPPFVTPVAVFADERLEAIRECMSRTCCSAVQLHGSEPPFYLEALSDWTTIKALRVRTAGDLENLVPYGEAGAYLLDAYVPGKPGGTGATFDWSVLAGVKFKKPVILAGGLTPDNLAAALTTVKPYAVDVVSGIEASPGKKDHEKMRRFIQIVRAFDAAQPAEASS